MSAYSDDALDRPIARTDGLATEKVNHELVIYDDASKQAHCLSPAVAAIWALCDGDTSQGGMSEKLGVSPESITEAVDELSRLGLLVEQTGINRREAAKRFATVGAAAIAGPALISSIAVPAAAAACSTFMCSNTADASNAYTDWNDIPQGDSAWFRAVLNSFSGWTPDTTSQILVTGQVSLPNLNNPVPPTATIPTRITFTTAGTTVSLTFRNNPAYFGGATFADEVVPLSCLSDIYLNGLMYYAAADMGPGGGSKAWYFAMNMAFSGHGPGTTGSVDWAFGASGYSGQPAPPNNGTAAYYNSLDIKPASGACTTVVGAGGDVTTPEAITGQHYGGGSGGGGANYTGSNSSAQKCNAVCA